MRDRSGHRDAGNRALRLRGCYRSSCNTAGEETRNLDEVHFNMDYFEAFTAGFMEKAKHLFTLKEKKTLAQGCMLMTYLQAVRFLTDYLDGDHYYPITYPEHNLPTG